MTTVSDRISGVIYGQLIGDALGSRYEFKDSQKVKNMIENDLELDFLNILGGGAFRLKAGQITDDSEMALGLLWSIIDKGTYDKEDVSKQYISWYRSGPFDIGKTILNAFNNSNSYDDCINNSNNNNSNSLSNGCLMRISPLAILGLKLTDKELFKYCKEDCKITHPNSITIDAVRVFCMTIKLCIKGETKERIIEKAYNISKESLVRSILISAEKRPEPVILQSGRLVKTDSKYMGYFGIALQNAFYELINGHSFYDSMLNIIKRGGDTDTNACIAGALLGAYYGSGEIPKKWKKQINIRNPRVFSYQPANQETIEYMIFLLKKKLNLPTK